jgi:hypothetical protein
MVNCTDNEFNNESILEIIPKLKDLTKNQNDLEIDKIKEILNSV